MRIRSLVSSLKWLYPGMRVKRWLLLVPVGVAAVLMGVILLVNWRIDVYLTHFGEQAYRQFGIDLGNPAILLPICAVLITAGLLLIFTSLRQVVRSITSVVSPEAEGKLADVIFQRRYLSQGQRIVVVGGGTGLSTMLRGLKNIQAIL